MKASWTRFVLGAGSMDQICTRGKIHELVYLIKKTLNLYLPLFYWLKDIVSIHDIIDYYSIITEDKSKVIYWDFIKLIASLITS